MPYNRKYNATRAKYNKEEMHTVALIYKNSDYKLLKEAADAEGRPVATYCKKCINFYETCKKMMESKYGDIE